MAADYERWLTAEQAAISAVLTLFVILWRSALGALSFGKTMQSPSCNWWKAFQWRILCGFYEAVSSLRSLEEFFEVRKGVTFERMSSKMEETLQLVGLQIQIEDQIFEDKSFEWKLWSEQLSEFEAEVRSKKFGRPAKSFAGNSKLTDSSRLHFNAQLSLSGFKRIPPCFHVSLQALYSRSPPSSVTVKFRTVAFAERSGEGRIRSGES